MNKYPMHGGEFFIMQTPSDMKWVVRMTLKKMEKMFCRKVVTKEYGLLFQNQIHNLTHLEHCKFETEDEAVQEVRTYMSNRDKFVQDYEYLEVE